MARSRTADYDLVIVGAGAAGLGASEAAKKSNIDHLVLEASHRIGGRGLTEYLEGSIPVDLGCHWMHSASLNPYVKWADKFGEYYETDESVYRMHFSGEWLSGEKVRDYDQFSRDCFRKIFDEAKISPESSVFNVIESDSEWSRHYYYWMSLLHSVDVDEIAVQDVVNYKDTDENWPLKNGYGNLISKQGRDCPVKLNSEVREIDWQSNPVKISTSNGVISADKVIITVSTGVLGAGHIKFTPELPVKKTESIHGLPLGNSNYQFFSFKENTFEEHTPVNIHFEDGDISMAIRIRPFNTPCLFTSTGGRFAWWLEKQGLEASKQYLTDALVKIFGGEIRENLNEFKASAWGYDPWIRGAYSTLKPGLANLRNDLAQPVDDCLFFAGEAASPEFFSTAHGAYLSGKSAVRALHKT